MTINAVRLENFMAFADTGWIELRPITLLFGRNSSGKSVIIRALRLLRQSLDHVSEHAPFVFASENGVDLGKFETIAHKHALKEPITFHFRCDLSQATTNVLDALRKRIKGLLIEGGHRPILGNDMSTELEMGLSFAWDQKMQYVVPIAIQIICPWDAVEKLSKHIILSAERHLEEIEEQGSWTWSTVWTLWSELLHEHERGKTEAPWASATFSLNVGFLPRLTALPGKTLPDDPKSTTDFGLVSNLLGEFQAVIEGFLRSIEYIGPIRPDPVRAYSLDQFDKRRWEQRGLKAFVRYLAEDVDEEKGNQISAWINRLDLGSAVKPTKYYAGDLGLMSEVNLDESTNTFKVNLVDVGFGASQVLPILVQSVLAEQGKLVIIEQPELHLHPRAQASLADLFVNKIQKLVENPTRPEEPKREYTGVHFLLETHSEHILLRLRRRIIETASENAPKEIDINRQLTNDDLALYFAERLHGQGIVQSVSINRLGEFEYVPAGFRDFFADDMEEILAISRAHRRAKALQEGDNDSTSN